MEHILYQEARRIRRGQNEARQHMVFRHAATIPVRPGIFNSYFLPSDWPGRYRVLFSLGRRRLKGFRRLWVRWSWWCDGCFSCTASPCCILPRVYPSLKAHTPVMHLEMIRSTMRPAFEEGDSNLSRCRHSRTDGRRPIPHSCSTIGFGFGFAEAARSQSSESLVLRVQGLSCA